MTHDMHGGYGRCNGLRRVWVDDGEASNFYRAGSCPDCTSETFITILDRPCTEAEAREIWRNLDFYFGPGAGRV